MVKEIDARGLACPAPVLLVKEIVEREQPGQMLVRVDNEAARENVSRFLTSRGFMTSSSGQGADMVIAAGGDGHGAMPAPAAILPRRQELAGKIMVLLGSDKIGAGDDELGGKLMTSFIKTLKEMGDDLWRLVFINSGVKLVAAGSPVLEDLTAYEQNGLTILACGACLSHFGLINEKKCGQVTNMLDIVTAMQLADKVITLG
jgi:selenium metabolism protein YedF